MRPDVSAPRLRARQYTLRQTATHFRRSALPIYGILRIPHVTFQMCVPAIVRTVPDVDLCSAASVCHRRPRDVEQPTKGVQPVNVLSILRELRDDRNRAAGDPLLLLNCPGDLDLAG